MKLRSLLLLVTVFITGAAVLILEVAAVRMLSPYYGSSLYVFSSVLTVILAALSGGYWYGGIRADQKHSVGDLYLLITLSGIIVLLLLLLAQVLLPFYAERLNVEHGPLLFSLGLFFIPAFLLGMISPYVIKLLLLDTDTEHSGSIVGATFFFGTCGSIIGSLSTGFLLIPLFGVENTIMLVSVTLMLLGLGAPVFFGHALRERTIIACFAAVLLFGGSVYALQVFDASRFLYSASGLYSSIKIYDVELHSRPARLLKRDINNSSAIYLDSNDPVFAYTQFIDLHRDLFPNPQQVLMLGGGAYTIPRTLLQENETIQVDVVEIEPSLLELAHEYFDLPHTERLTNYAMDARVYLSRTDKKYDVIFIDVFDTNTAAPFHLTTTEFQELLDEHLTEHGVVITNYIGKPKPDTRPSYTGSFIKTTLRTFPNTKAFAINAGDREALQNIVFVSRNSDKPIDALNQTVTNFTGETYYMADMEIDLSRYNLEPEFLLTDDHAPVEYLMAKQQ